MYTVIIMFIYIHNTLCGTQLSYRTMRGESASEGLAQMYAKQHGWCSSLSNASSLTWTALWVKVLHLHPTVKTYLGWWDPTARLPIYTTEPAHLSLFRINIFIIPVRWGLEEQSSATVASSPSPSWSRVVYNGIINVYNGCNETYQMKTTSTHVMSHYYTVCHYKLTFVVWLR